MFLRYTTIALCALLAFSGCRKKGCTDSEALNFDADARKDDGTCEYGYSVPETYNFSNVDFSGQTTRIDMLEELTTYMKSANDSAVSLTKAKLAGMFANQGGYFSQAALNGSTKQLQNKCFAPDTSLILSYFDSIVVASQANKAGSNGQAGVVISSTDPSKQYLCSATGVEYTQLIDKTLMGTVFYYQIAEGYTRPEKIGDAVDLADQEHHWDEAFGYFAVPLDFPTNTDGARYIGKYCNSRDALLGTNAEAMDAFLKGRAGITNEDPTARDLAASDVRAAIEKVFVGTAIHYLNGAVDDLADDALRNHQLSEAYAFIYSLRYNSDRIITSTQIDALLTELGTDFYNISAADINSVRDQLASIYSLTSIKNSL